MADLAGCVETVVDVDVDRNEVLILGPECVLQTTPGVYFGEVPCAADLITSEWVSGERCTQLREIRAG